MSDDAVEALAAGIAVREWTRQVLLRMTDVLTAVVDTELQPPGQGDGDHGHGLIVDGAGTDRWASRLATVDALLGRLASWPTVNVADVRTPVLASLTGPHQLSTARPMRRPAHVADAGLTIPNLGTGGG